MSWASLVAEATLARGGRPVALPRLTAALGPGVAILYLSFMVALPIAALTAKASTERFWPAITSPQAKSALLLTLGMALIATVINAVTGVLVAWVLVRDDFPGKAAVNAVIDLPFALPTIVAGLVLMSLYGPNSPVHVNVVQSRAAVLLALLFVTLPFVVRAVQPVLLGLDMDVEAAAACLGAGRFQTFRRITLPAILPATLTGAGLAFARSLGEFGSIVLISGNIPFKTQVASVFISGQVESGDTNGAAAVSVVLLLAALGGLALLNLATRRMRARHGYGPASLGGARLPGAHPARPGGDDRLPHVRARDRTRLGRADDARRPARAVPLRRRDRDRRADQPRLRHHRRHPAGPSPDAGGQSRQPAHQPAVRDVAGRHRPRLVRALRPHRLDRRLAGRTRPAGPLLLPRDRAGDGVRLPAVRRPRGRPSARGARRRPGAGCRDARRQPDADVLADHSSRDALGARLRRGPERCPRARRVRSRQHRLRQHRRSDPNASAARGGAVPRLRPHRCLQRRVPARGDLAADPLRDDFPVPTQGAPLDEHRRSRDHQDLR